MPQVGIKRYSSSRTISCQASEILEQRFSKHGLLTVLCARGKGGSTWRAGGPRWSTNPRVPHLELPRRWVAEKFPRSQQVT